MRSKLLLIVGCIVVALFAVGMVVLYSLDAAEDPLRLITSEPGLRPRIKTTTTAIVSAIIGIIVLIVLVAFAVKRATTRLEKNAERPVSLLTNVREHLRTEYPKYSDRDGGND